MNNRTTVQHGTLADLRAYLIRSGWTIEPPVGAYEVLRARCPGYPRPLLIYDRTTGGCGYSYTADPCCQCTRNPDVGDKLETNEETKKAQH